MSYGREHFMSANISWARIFHEREYFDVCGYFTGKQIFGVCADISRCAHIF
jgi:hypothetical protein